MFRAASPQPVLALKENYERVAGVVKSHIAGGYYRSASPFLSPLSRLRTYFIDRSAARGCDAPKQVLDKLIRTYVDSR